LIYQGAGHLKEDQAMENRENQNSDISKSQAAQQPNFDQSKKQPELGEKKQPEFDQSGQTPASDQPGLDKSSDTLAEQRQDSETDSAESLDQRGQAQPGFVGSGEDESSDELIEEDKQSDGE